MSTQQAELGTLIIVILKARNLNDKHSFYKQDVFAQVTFNGITKRTKVAVKGGQHPEWDEEVRFPVFKQPKDKYRKLEVACFAKEHKSDDILGKGEVDIVDTLKTGEFDEWVPLNVDGIVRGDLYLEMTFFSNAPVSTTTSSLALPSNLQRHPSKLAPLERLNRPSHEYVPPGSVQQARLPHSPGPQSGHQSRPHLSMSPPPGPNPAVQSALHNLLSDSPRTAQRPSNNAYDENPHGHHAQASSSSSRSSSASSMKRADSPLPPLPANEELGSSAPLSSNLLPGRGRPHPQMAPYPHTTTQLPSTLRAGPGRVVSQPAPSSHIPPHVRQASLESVGSSQARTDHTLPASHVYVPGPTLPHTLHAGNVSHAPELSYYPSQPKTVPLAQTLHTSQHSTTSIHLGSESTPEPFPFPIPMPFAPSPGKVVSHAYNTPPPQTNYTPPQQVGYTGPLPAASYSSPPPQSIYIAPPRQASYPIPPPQTAYISPPLPYHQPSLSNDFPDPYLQARYQTPLPLPSGSENQPHGRQPHPPSTNNPDQARIEALRQIEEESKHRKDQEEKDLALALALDRELNIGSESETTPTAAIRSNVTMPGGW